MNRSYLILVTFLITCIACNSKQEADHLFINGTIYTVDSSFTVDEAFAVLDGKILMTGSTKDLLKRYSTKNITDLKGNFVYPGFQDAHCHLYGYGIDKNKISLHGTNSFEEILQILRSNKEKLFSGWIFGRGWDQNDWPVKEFPDNIALDSLFPDLPVILLRIDGHAALLNSKALEIAGINENTKIDGGDVIKKEGKLTGVILDNVVDIVYQKMPGIDPELSRTAILAAQSDCYKVGLTSLTDAGFESTGLKYDIIKIFKNLEEGGQLKLRVDAMADPAEADIYRNEGKIKTQRFTVNGFKAYADGALGSRGACLLQPYSDSPTSYGTFLNSPQKLIQYISVAHELNMQINIHCIGDSAQRFVLKAYNNILNGSNPQRWRIEHAQVVNLNDLPLYSKSAIIPSVQPTHATSDMYWAEDRLGSERIKGAYAYRSLLEVNNMIVAGSDFPVESINPLFGFYAAVTRKDQKGYPEKGFMLNESLSREQALRAMTCWAAYGSFREETTGTLEAGKYADFVILDQDIMTAPQEQLYKAAVIETWIQSERVYSAKE